LRGEKQIALAGIAIAALLSQTRLRIALKRNANKELTMSRIVKNAAVSTLAALSFIAVPTFARAACGIYGVPGSKAVIKLPAVLPHADFDSRPSADKSIVGLWHVIYTAADQTLFNDTFDTWHSDHTEFESAFLAPAGGDVCVGVWKENGSGTITLHHIGWLFNPNTPTANASNYFTLDQENTVDPNGKSYTGTFTFKIWNLDGTPTMVEINGVLTQEEVKGTLAATRITAD
jgi:hypothetical protein